MTFYEAALRVLEGEGRPLHVQQITEKSIAQNLLSHVGKMPEVTMLSRLAAMARRARDRRVVVTAKDTFALADWSLPEDAEALAQTGLPVENPEEALPPLRPVERHPEPRSEGARPSGRGERKRRHEEEDSGGRKRRYPPLAEVAFEVLSESAEPLTPAELVERGHRRELNGKDLSREQILSALAEDNQRRLDSGRRLQFFLLEESGQVGLIERSGTAQGMSAGDIQGAFGRALGGAVGAVTESAVKTLKAQAKEARRAAAKAFASRLLSLDAATFERCVVKALQGLGFRDLKVAKRSKEGPLLTARKREGSVELRYAVRLARGSGPVDRRVLQELRRDLGHYAAHVGLVASAADARADARSEAQGGGALVFLWCGEALAEKFFEARAGVAVTTVEVFEPDEPFFDQMRTEAAELQQRREERSGERSRRGDEPRRNRSEETADREPPAGSEGSADSAESEAEGVEAAEFDRISGEAPEAPAEVEGDRASAPDEVAEEGDDEGDEAEGDEGDEAVSATSADGAVGEPRKRRRRRRGRRGRGPRPAEAGAAAGPRVAAAGEPDAGSAALPPSEAPSPPPAPASAGEAPGDGGP